ncbi:MAG: hypothetical protein LBV43_06975 [Prevotella sp.]|jgi:hypothetical protein|nr:hypothetical protein [Prevotella sp.]
MTGKDKQLLIFASKILRCCDDLYLYKLVASIPGGKLQLADKRALSEVGFPTDFLNTKEDIFSYLNREAPKYIKRYKKEKTERRRPTNRNSVRVSSAQNIDLSNIAETLATSL